MSALLLFIGFVLCVWGAIRGTARAQQWTPRSSVAVALFWSSVIGCLSTAAVIVATILLVAAFDETKDMNPAFPKAWAFSMSALRVSSGASLLFHLLLFLIPGHGATTKPNVTITQRLSLIWRRFAPLEVRLIAAVREVLPPQAQVIFDAQIAGITLVQRHPNEICFYRRRLGKVDWSGVLTFPRTGEFRLAEVQFSVERQRYKATLTSIAGHIFDFTVTPSPKAIAFADWDSGSSARLLSDPLTMDSASEPQPMPDSWREFLTGRHALGTDEWTLHDAETAYRAAFADGEFLVLAEREGDQFVLHRIEPPASTLFYLDSHDGMPEPIKGEILDILRQPDNRNT